MAEFAKKTIVVKYVVELSQDEFNIILNLLEDTNDASTPGSYQLWKTFNSEADD